MPDASKKLTKTAAIARFMGLFSHGSQMGGQ
jgi:hypothetical protein